MSSILSSTGRHGIRIKRHENPALARTEGFRSGCGIQKTVCLRAQAPFFSESAELLFLSSTGIASSL